ncbi:MAG: hypothetical protein ACRDP6_15395 [Actinoallomurus sp.]
MSPETRPRNPKVRITGVVVTLLGAWSLFCALTGFEAASTGGRVALGALGAAFVVIGLLLMRSRTPGVRDLRATASGIHVRLVDGQSQALPWSSIGSVTVYDMFRLPRPGGTMLRFTYADGVAHPPLLAPFERNGHVLLPTPNRPVALALKESTPRYAGARFLDS